MNQSIKNKLSLLIYIFILLFIFAIITSITGNWIWHSNVNRYINKIYKNQMSIKVDNGFSYKGRDYRIIFSTPKDKEDELYLQCFEEKFYGLIYIPTYGSRQGESKSLYGMICHFLNNSANDRFFIVYGYNKNLKANNFSVRKTGDGKWITQDISKQKYFLYIYSKIEYAKIFFKDMYNNDLTAMFNGQ